MVVNCLYYSVEVVKEMVQIIWVIMDIKDYLEVFDGYLMIGDVNSLCVKYVNMQVIVVFE